MKWRPAMATLIGSPQGGLGAATVPGLRQQHAESVCGLGMATVIREPERIAGADTVAFPEEEHATSKRRSAILLTVVS